MVMTLTDRPGVEDFKKEKANLDEVWENGHTAMREADDHFFMKFNIWAAWKRDHPTATDRPNFHSGRAVSLMMQAADTNISLEPAFHRKPVHDTPESEAHADALEKGLGAAFLDAFLWTPNIPTKVNALQFMRHNYTQLWLSLDTEGLERPERMRGEDVIDFEMREWEWQARRATWNPMRLEVPAPGEVLMDPFEKNPKVAIRKKKKLAMELNQLTINKAAKNSEINVFSIVGKEPYDKVTIFERWSSHWVAVYLEDGQEIYTEKNTWGMQPGSHAFFGSADSPAGMEFDIEWWIRQAMIFRVMDTMVMEDQATILTHLLLARAATAKTIYDGNPAVGAAAKEGDIIPGREEDWGIEKTPQVPGQMFQHKEELRDSITRNTYSPVAAGFRQAGVQTATEQLMLSEATNKTFKAPVKQMEHLYSITGSKALILHARMTKKFPDEYGAITIGEFSLDVKDMEDRYYIQASFAQTDAVVRSQESSDGRLDLKDGIIGKKTMRKIRRYENPTELADEVLEDKALALPELEAKLVADALKKLGQEELGDKLKADVEASQLLGPRGEPISSNGRV